MTAGNEQIEAKIETRKDRKRWAAPEVTRLDFPKTASGFGSANSDGTFSSAGS
jgi:hypothetical protein